jgi:hypothetical protein
VVLLPRLIRVHRGTVIGSLVRRVVMRLSGFFSGVSWELGAADGGLGRVMAELAGAGHGVGSVEDVVPEGLANVARPGEEVAIDRDRDQS